MTCVDPSRSMHDCPRAGFQGSETDRNAVGNAASSAGRLDESVASSPGKHLDDQYIGDNPGDAKHGRSIQALIRPLDETRMIPTPDQMAWVMRVGTVRSVNAGK